MLDNSSSIVAQIEALLPRHGELVESSAGAFRSVQGIRGCFLAGSLATNRADEFSDVDIFVVVDTETERQTCWNRLPSLTQRIRRILFSIELSEAGAWSKVVVFRNLMRLHVTMLIPSELESTPELKESLVLWYRWRYLEDLALALAKNPAQPSPAMVRTAELHLWYWTFSGSVKLHRGELLAAMDSLSKVRQLLARLTDWAGARTQQGFRRVEDRWSAKEYRKFREMCPPATKEGLQRAFSLAITYAHELTGSSRLVTDKPADLRETRSLLRAYLQQLLRSSAKVPSDEEEE